MFFEAMAFKFDSAFGELAQGVEQTGVKVWGGGEGVLEDSRVEVEEEGVHAQEGDA